ncbi:MAG: alpha/beta fold hydrolase BchO [Pseudomonadota bacterium]
MSRPLDWDREGCIWPHREASEFVQLGGAVWHVQSMGASKNPRALLIHGTGASVHSWRHLMPLLARDFHVTAMDLPRHAFTQGHPPDWTSMPRMAGALTDLMAKLGMTPDLVIGHSAGAALALQLSLDHGFAGPIIGLNSALRPFPGPASQIFPAVAKLLFVNPFVPRIFSKMATFNGEAGRFLYRATGSRIEPEGLACYEALLANSRHTKGALSMMANWDLPTLRTRMRAIANPVLLIHSDLDAAIPLEWAEEARDWLPNAALETLKGLGHLAHEEAPERSLAIIRRFAKAHVMALPS